MSDFEDDALEEGLTVPIRAKWLMDGATTLSEAAQKLEAYAQQLREMEKDGITLGNPIEDDYGFVTAPSQSVYDKHFSFR